VLDAVPPSACSIVVEAASSKAATCFLGLIVHGKGAAIDSFIASASARQINVSRVAGEKNEAMAVFQAGTAAEAALWLFREATSGRLGKLKVEIIVSPAASAGDGVDLDSEVRVVDSDYLAFPGSR